MDKNKVISLYIHIPFCVSKCSYCDFFSIPTNTCTNAVSEEYINALCNEINYRINEYGQCSIKTVYVGGGTPSLLTQNQISKLCDVIKRAGLCEQYEFTFEVNPDDINERLLTCLQDNGVNRLSVGIQSFCENVLKTVHRRATVEQNYNCFLLFDKLWKQRLSVDLICGLPGETEASIMKSLEFLVQKNISHISFYSLCVEEETPLGKAIIENTQSYSQDFSDELWIKGRDYLLENGYEQYEVSNFCKEGNECLHNMTYWTHKDYLACGSGGTGTVYENNGEGIRYTNTKNIKEYIDFWLNPEQKTGKNDVNVPQDVEKIIHQTSKFEYFMMALRTKRGLSPKEYEAIFNEKIPPEILTKLKNTCLQTPQGFFYLSSEKLLFLNSLLEDILSLLD